MIEEARLSGIQRIDALADEQNIDAINLLSSLGFNNAGPIGGGRRTGESETLRFFKDLEPLSFEEQKHRRSIAIARSDAFKKKLERNAKKRNSH